MELILISCHLTVSTDDAPDKAMRTNFLSTFGIATDQGGKLGLGKAKSMICMYENFQVTSSSLLTLKFPKLSEFNFR
jgi:ragulator complex protein LAMTOR3